MIAIRHKASTKSETELIRKAAQGDSSAFGVLYERYLNPIYRYLYFRIGDEASAEDMTEEVFVRAWESLPRYQVRKDSFKSWLYRIAHNLYVDTLRKKTPQTIENEEMENKRDEHPLPEETLSRQQDMATLTRAVQQLNDIEQQVVLLRFVDGLSHREVGRFIGKSEQASRVIQHRALTALHAILSQEEISHV